MCDDFFFFERRTLIELVACGPHSSHPGCQLSTQSNRKMEVIPGQSLSSLAESHPSNSCTSRHLFSFQDAASNADMAAKDNQAEMTTNCLPTRVDNSPKLLTLKHKIHQATKCHFCIIMVASYRKQHERSRHEAKEWKKVQPKYNKKWTLFIYSKQYGGDWLPTEYLTNLQCE